MNKLILGLIFLFTTYSSLAAITINQPATTGNSNSVPQATNATNVNGGTVVATTGAFSGAISANGGLTVNGTSVTADLSATSISIGGSSLIAGQCASATTTVIGATTTMVVFSSPTTYPGDGDAWDSYISAANTVVTKVCAIVAGTPVTSTYNIRVIQ